LNLSEIFQSLLRMILPEQAVADRNPDRGVVRQDLHERRQQAWNPQCSPNEIKKGQFEYAPRPSRRHFSFVKCGS
jgi:hypothetical protein